MRSLIVAHALPLLTTPASAGDDSDFAREVLRNEPATRAEHHFPGWNT